MEKQLADFQKAFAGRAKPVVEPTQTTEASKPDVLTQKGFWVRFHELRSSGFSKSDAFRIVSLEAIEAVTKQNKEQ